MLVYRSVVEVRLFFGGVIMSFPYVTTPTLDPKDIGDDYSSSELKPHPGLDQRLVQMKSPFG